MMTRGRGRLRRSRPRLSETRIIRRTRAVVVAPPPSFEPRRLFRLTVIDNFNAPPQLVQDTEENHAN
jgi:hypothetical protein